MNYLHYLKCSALVFLVREIMALAGNHIDKVILIYTIRKAIINLGKTSADKRKMEKIWSWEWLEIIS